jgi:hypothetical protein
MVTSRHNGTFLVVPAQGHHDKSVQSRTSVKGPRIGNAYLTPDERAVAGGTLYEDLRTGE